MDNETGPNVNGALLQISTAGRVKLDSKINVAKIDIECTNA